MYLNPNPHCTGNCMFVRTGETPTRTTVPPIYDKKVDDSITEGKIHCVTCERNWTYKIQPKHAPPIYKEMP